MQLGALPPDKINLTMPQVSGSVKLCGRAACTLKWRVISPQIMKAQ